MEDDVAVSASGEEVSEIDGSPGVAGSPGAFEATFVFFVVLGAIALGAHRFLVRKRLSSAFFSASLALFSAFFALCSVLLSPFSLYFSLLFLLSFFFFASRSSRIASHSELVRILAPDTLCATGFVDFGVATYWTKYLDM